MRVTATLVLAPAILSLATATCSPRDTRSDALTRRGRLGLSWARDHLAEPFEGYGPLDDLGVRAFDAILLSHLAMGLMNVSYLERDRDRELDRMATEVVRRVLDARVQPRGAESAPGDHNLYVSHALLALGVEHHLALAAGRDATEHDALAEGWARHLARASLSHPSAHARSYPGSPRWPADQSVTLAALALHDRERGTNHAERPVAGYLRWLGEHETDGLPWSAVGGVSYTRVPRGCALSFISTYMAHFAPEEGARLYGRYRDRHGIDFFGYGGFREWPDDDERGSDVDAGPVILGWGTAATGIGLGAARLYGDAQQVAGIERLADTVGLGLPRSARYLLAPTLGQAMLFSGATATPWGEDLERVGPNDTGWPTGAFAMLLAALGLLYATWRRPR